MFYGIIDEQMILEISRGLCPCDRRFILIDRQARELSRHTLGFYREFLRPFIEYCNANSLTFIQEITQVSCDAPFSRLEKNIIQVMSMEPIELYRHSSSGL